MCRVHIKSPLIVQPSNVVLFTLLNSTPLRLMRGTTIGFSQNLNNMSFVFIALMFIKLLYDRSAVCSADIWSRVDWPWQISYRVESSTYLYVGHMVVRSSIIITNSKGPALVPCVTPPLSSNQLDATLQILTHCFVCPSEKPKSTFVGTLEFQRLTVSVRVCYGLCNQRLLSSPPAAL